jgi:HAD superfamily hydrolase (TIGR01509 family)
VFADRGIPTDKVGEWVLRKQALTVQLLRDSPRLYPGVVPLVRHLAGKVRLAIVSDTWRENIQAVLDFAGLTAAFATIVAKEDVTTAKPDPQSYLLALKRLRRSPRSVVAIEDSPSGLEAARAAGIARNIAVGHRRPFGDWASGGTYISGFEPVEGLLKHLGL